MKTMLLLIRNERGAALVISLLFLTVLSILGVAGITTSTTDIKIASNSVASAEALYIAEAGLKRAEAELLKDLDTDDDMGNANFNALAGLIPITPSTSFYTPTGFNNVAFGEGSYTIELKNYPKVGGGFEPETILVRSTGVGPNSSTRVLESYLYAENVNVWDNAIFAGGGGGLPPITGNVKIGGSIHLLGIGLASGDTVFNNQTGQVFNDNTAMDPGLIPLIDGGTTTDLKAKFRAKQGKVDMNGGSGKLGASSNPLRGIYVGAGTDTNSDTVNDGIDGGNNGVGGTGSQDLFAQKGAGSPEAYDMGNSLTMPAIDTAYLDANCLDLTTVVDQTDGPWGNLKGLINGDLELAEKWNPNWKPDIFATDGTNTINWDSVTKKLTVTGLVKVRTLTITDDVVEYTNSNGTIYAANTAGTVVTIGRSLKPESPNSFPSSAMLGIISGGDISLGTNAQLELAGIFFSAGTITISKQTDVAGAIVCQAFDMTNQVPKIWYVPKLDQYLPFGMPGGASAWSFTERTWREVPN